jgi:L-threonylcarbamoyladenylate synthase
MVKSLIMERHLQNKLISANSVIANLLKGQVGVLPTDTVYGLTARAYDTYAVTRLYALKNRDHKPGTVIAANIEQLHDLGVSRTQLDKVRPWWPGPLSVVLNISDKYSYLHQDVGDIAIRVTADTQLKSILEKTGPLLTTSANQPGEPPAATVQQAYEYFKDEVDFYVDGGDLSGRAPSTIIRITPAGEVELLRDGAFTLPD